MSRKPYWEENGFTTEWYYHRYRIRTERMADDELVRLVRLHGDKAAEELRTGVVCPNVKRYEAVMQRIRTEAVPTITPPAPPLDSAPTFRQLDLFAGASCP